MDVLLWFACDVAEVAVIGLLLYRRLWRTFPLFLSYISWALISNVGGYVVLRIDNASYATAYLVVVIVDSILLFGVLVELAWSILRPVRASLSRRALVPVVGLILIVAVVVWPLAAVPGLAGASVEARMIAHLQQTISILQVVFFLALIAGSQLLSIGWRDRELQVATGLGFFSFVDIAAAVLHMHQTSYLQYRHLFQVEIGAYICSLIYWVVSLSQKEAERRAFTPKMQSMLLAVAGAARSTRVALEDSRTGKPLKQNKR